MISIDAREMEHPIPLELTIEAFKKLKGSEIIHLIHRREPLPLFEILTKNGGFYLSRETIEGVWHIHITRDPNLNLEALHV